MARILLAEDDDDMRRFLVKALERAGYQVSDFDNGASAYERLREEPFSLLLTDIVMPEMDGIELARRATEIDPDLKVMFITGFAAVALNRIPKRRKTPRCCRNLSTCAISSTRSKRCCRRLEAFLAALCRRDKASRSFPFPAIDALDQKWCMRGFGWACSSAGEHCIDIAGVTGSIPVTPTIQHQLLICIACGHRLIDLR